MVCPRRVSGSSSRATRPTGAFYGEEIVPLHRYVYARTGNRADSEDVTSQVFLEMGITLTNAKVTQLRALRRAAELGAEEVGMKRELCSASRRPWKRPCAVG